MANPITTLTLIRYNGLRNKAWAFGMMQFAHKHLQDVAGMAFYKLMGSGKGLGFNPWPDWSVYSILQTWESEADAQRFFDSSKLAKSYRNHSQELMTVYLSPLKSHGTWSGQKPFANSSEEPKHPYLAVLTRAVIKTSKLRKFWNYVPTAQKPIEKAEGLLYTKGVGEVPFKNMATFSVWESKEKMMAYAYKSEEHKIAIKMTRELKWYSEELFARFALTAIEGKWEGRELIQELSRKR